MKMKFYTMLPKYKYNKFYTYNLKNLNFWNFNRFININLKVYNNEFYLRNPNLSLNEHLYFNGIWFI